MNLRCPNGYRFHVVSTETEISGYDITDAEPNEIVKTIKIELRRTSDREMIGYVDLVWRPVGFWETHSYLDEAERGHGLGTLMYAKAIDTVLKRGSTVRSSERTSDAAKQVWRSRGLNELFNITRKNDRFHVISRKTQRN